MNHIFIFSNTRPSSAPLLTGPLSANDAIIFSGVFPGCTALGDLVLLDLGALDLVVHTETEIHPALNVGGDEILTPLHVRLIREVSGTVEKDSTGVVPLVHLPDGSRGVVHKVLVFQRGELDHLILGETGVLGNLSHSLPAVEDRLPHADGVGPESIGNRRVHAAGRLWIPIALQRLLLVVEDSGSGMQVG